MDLDELLITTGVDALIKLIKEKKEIELIDAARILQISSQKVREWSQILEDEGILSIKYNLGKSTLVWVQPTNEEIVQEKSSFYDEKQSLSDEIAKKEEEKRQFEEKLLKAKEREEIDDLKRMIKESSKKKKG